MKTRIWITAVAVISMIAIDLPVNAISQTAGPDSASSKVATNDLHAASAAPMVSNPTTSAKPSTETTVAEESVSWIVSEITKMFQAGVGDPVILAYIQGSEVVTPSTGQEVIYLKQKGLSTEVITVLIRRGAELQAKRAAAVVQTEPLKISTPTVVQPAQIITQAVPIQAPAVTYPTVTYYSTPQVVPSTYYNYDPPVYYTSYPRYPYGYNYYWWNSPIITYSTYSGYYAGHPRGNVRPLGRIGAIRSSPPARGISPGHSIAAPPRRGISGPGRGFTSRPLGGSPSPGRRGR